MTAGKLRDRPAWRVSIPAHGVVAATVSGVPKPGLYVVPASVRVQFESSRRSAVRMAVEAAHIAAGVPAWKPYLRQTARLVSVERIQAVALGGGEH